MKRKWLPYVVMFAILILLAVFMWRNWEQFLQAFSQASKASMPVALLAIGLVGFGITVATLAYKNLAIKPVSFKELFIIENVAVLASRVLPAGIGGMGVHGMYLHKRKHTVSQATTVVATNNALGFLAHLSLLGLSVVLAPSAISQFNLGSRFSQGWIPLGLISVVVVALSLPPVRERLKKVGNEIKSVLKIYAKNPRKLIFATILLGLLTISNVIILWLAGSEITGAHFANANFATLIIIYSLGVLLGASVPTPGGLAGVEAGLVAGMIALGIELPSAIAVALLFRLATYWVPIIPGLIFLFYAKRLKLI